MVKIVVGNKTLEFNNVYYVNGETGNDNNNGLTKNTALRNFATAVGKCVDGDAIYLSGVTLMSSSFTVTKEISVIGDGLTSILQGQASVDFTADKKITIYKAIIKNFMRFTNSNITSQFIFHNCIIQDFSGNASFGNHSFSDNGNSLGYAFSNCSFIGTHSSKFYSFNTSTPPIFKATKCTLSNSAFTLTAYTGRVNYTNQSTDNKVSVTLGADFKAEEGYGVWSGEFSWAISPRLNKILFLSNDMLVRSIETGSLQTEKATPKMTSDTTPSGVVTSTGTDGWRAFDELGGQGFVSNGKIGYLQYDFQKDVRIGKYVIRSGSATGAQLTGIPKDWTFEGSNDNANWRILDSQTGQTWATVNTEKQYFIQNPKYFKMYRIKWTDNNGNSTYTNISELILFAISASAFNTMPEASKNNFIRYGSDSIEDVTVLRKVNYILQDTVSENEQGLWTTQINKKPLSIKFD